MSEFRASVSALFFISREYFYNTAASWFDFLASLKKLFAFIFRSCACLTPSGDWPWILMVPRSLFILLTSSSLWCVAVGYLTLLISLAREPYLRSSNYSKILSSDCFIISAISFWVAPRLRFGSVPWLLPFSVKSLMFDSAAELISLYGTSLR